MKTNQAIKVHQLHGGEAIKSGTLHASYEPATYRTKDGSAFYKFKYADIGGGKFEIDILSQPSYGSRADSLSVSHRLPSARGGHKICISVGHEPKTIEAAKNISMEWAELTHKYIQTGKSIDSQVSENAQGSGSGGGGLLDWLFG